MSHPADHSLVQLTPALRPLSRLLNLDQVNQTYAAATGAGGWDQFVARVLGHLNVTYRVSREDVARIPRSGPVLLAANHPFGCIEGIILAHLLAQVRPDVKIMANHLLARIPEMRELFIFVDPYGGPEAARANVRPLLRSIRLLESGGALGVFPAGAVSHLQLSSRTITDPPWDPAVARIVRKAKCPVLPVYFEGRNSTVFQLLGLLHPRLRTAMLARELFNKRDRRLHVRVGQPIPYAQLRSIDDDAELVGHLRRKTYLLAHRSDAELPPRPTPAAIAPRAVIDPVHPALIAAEVASLPPGALLVDAGEMGVYCAGADAVPHTLREIGRLRELTFRATGEGTGKAADLDRFDPHYLHLFVYHREKQEVVGAYRLGATDTLKAGGAGALYTSTLFNYKPTLLERLGPALEMGRSFVRAEYQRSFAPLLLLWKGIGHYVVRHPRYKVLFGPVSISNNYRSVSRQLMVQFFRTHHALADLAQLVRPRRPFRPDRLAASATAHGPPPADADTLSTLIADLEPDQKGIPILLKQYLKLGAKVLAFNLDPDFSDVLDALIYVDLSRTDARTLEKYMTKAGAASFFAHHGVGRA